MAYGIEARLKQFMVYTTSTRRKSQKYVQAFVQSSSKISQNTHTVATLQDEEDHQRKADSIVNAVLQILDKNRDGNVEVGELERVGVGALPSFEHMGAEGHHYDVESGTFNHQQLLSSH